MTRPAHRRILLVGDADRQIQSSLTVIIPTAHVTDAPCVFDAIAELSAGEFDVILLPVEPIERRPDVAVQTIRALAGQSRLVLYGQPGLEPLSRKMMELGCDDYVITPLTASDLQQALDSPLLRIVPSAAPDSRAEPTPQPHRTDKFGLPLTAALLESLLDHPADPLPSAVRAINSQIPPDWRLRLVKDSDEPPPHLPPGRQMISQTLPGGTVRLELQLPSQENSAEALAELARLTELLVRLDELRDRHARLQSLAITDDLTGLYNGRYFRHFLSRILERAREKLFPVTLLIFDIDDFKKYNDEYGHPIGDQILQQTAKLIRRCCRDHDLVARLGGDEFAVIFWDKDGPRQSKHAGESAPVRPPHSPEKVLERIKRMLARQQFPGLGAGGKGSLTISGGLAVFPYHAATMEELIELADRRLMFGAKRAGKNSIFLVGPEENPPAKSE
jgi:PleD family two-component response regulator